MVVTNHSLLFWDTRFEGGLLPPIRYWVVDEAHGAEAEARRAFSLSPSSNESQSGSAGEMVVDGLGAGAVLADVGKTCGVLHKMTS